MQARLRVRVDNPHRVSCLCTVMVQSARSASSKVQWHCRLPRLNIFQHEATNEAAWLCQHYKDIDGAPSLPITLYVDNLSAISIANKTETGKRSKHMDIEYYLICQEIMNNHVSTQHCYTDHMIADVLTKPVNRDRFEKLRDMLGVC